jgi:1,4-alpha-glucan branching enzyme
VLLIPPPCAARTRLWRRRRDRSAFLFNTEWKGRPWTDCVFYELHVGAFGGFAGVKAALPRLAEFGVTAVELTPISAFPGDLTGAMTACWRMRRIRRMARRTTSRR